MVQTQIIIGKKIKARRDELHMTQEDLCQAAGISQPYLSRVERNKFTPSIKALDRIAQALRLSVDELIERRAS
jgi:transcriptional regulator with XRE-family HTH domain